jgi:hypothetical protein
MIKAFRRRRERESLPDLEFGSGFLDAASNVRVATGKNR